MRRLLLLVITALIFLGGGCRQQEQPAPTPKPAPRPLRVIYLTIWADALNKEFHAVCNEWSKQSGIPVQVEDVALKDLSARLATYIGSGSGADLAVFPAHLTVLNGNRLADVTQVVNEVQRELGTPHDVARAMNTAQNKWVGVPLYAWSHIWVYRGDLLDQQGLKVAETWDDAASLARRLTRKPNLWGLGIGLGKDDDAAMFSQALLWSFGGSIFDKTGTQSKLNSPETRRALQWLLKLYQDGAIPPGALGWDGASNNKNFLAGSIAITANSPTIYYAAKRDKPELAPHIRHALYPKGPAGRFSYATEFSLAYLQQSQRAGDITSLLRFIFSRTNYERLIKAGEGSVNPLYNRVDAMVLWGNDPKLLPGLQSLDIERPVGWPGPVTPAAAEVFEQRTLTDVFSRVLNDKVPLDTAVIEADKRVTAILERHASAAQK